MIHKNKHWFTLIEIMVGILIVTIVFLGGFQALSSVSIGKARLIQQTDIQKESFYFTEKLFEMIKKSWTLDYEEYFNRKVLNLAGGDLFSDGHFDISSWFGNFWKNGNVGTTTYGQTFYYCRSGNNDSQKVGTNGCYNSNYNTTLSHLRWEDQRYGQYSFQFIDYNSNYDADSWTPWDEDGDWEIRWDDDDEYIWDGPKVFDEGVNLRELYLISWDKKTRTYYRWKVIKDPNATAAQTCVMNDSTNIIPATSDGCLGTVEYIRLLWKDRWMNHTHGTVADDTYLDGVIDTWVIDPEFSESTVGNEIIAWSRSDMDDYWVPLFPNTIHVSEFKMYGYPNKDIENSWNNTDPEVNISPYIVLKLKLKPSWVTRKQIKGEGRELDFSMTIHLTDIYSQ